MPREKTCSHCKEKCCVWIKKGREIFCKSCFSITFRPDSLPKDLSSSEKAERTRVWKDYRNKRTRENYSRRMKGGDTNE